MLIDAHCHLDLYRKPEETLREVERGDVLTVAVTNLPSHFREALLRMRGMRRVRPALGFHPLLVKQHPLEAKAFEDQLAYTSFVGEVGLDFSRHAPVDSRRDQMRGLEFVLERIQSPPRFVTLHSRGAEDEVLALLAKYRIRRPVLHWFSGSSRSLRRAVEYGCLFSVNTRMTETPSGRRLVAAMPSLSVLTETDGPFTSVEGRCAVPGDVTRVLDHLAELWGISKDETQQRVSRNFVEAVSLLGSGTARRE